MQLAPRLQVARDRQVGRRHVAQEQDARRTGAALGLAHAHVIVEPRLAGDGDGFGVRAGADPERLVTLRVDRHVVRVERQVVAQLGGVLLHRRVRDRGLLLRDHARNSVPLAPAHEHAQIEDRVRRQDHDLEREASANVLDQGTHALVPDLLALSEPGLRVRLEDAVVLVREDLRRQLADPGVRDRAHLVLWSERLQDVQVLFEEVVDGEDLHGRSEGMGWHRVRP